MSSLANDLWVTICWPISTWVLSFHSPVLVTFGFKRWTMNSKAAQFVYKACAVQHNVSKPMDVCFSGEGERKSSQGVQTGYWERTWSLSHGPGCTCTSKHTHTHTHHAGPELFSVSWCYVGPFSRRWLWHGLYPHCRMCSPSVWVTCPLVQLSSSKWPLSPSWSSGTAQFSSPCPAVWLRGRRVHPSTRPHR